MKLIATYVKHLFDRSGKAEVSFQVSNLRHAAMLDELDATKQYAIEIKEIKSQRSIEQNKLLWALLNELEKKTKLDSITWYIHALEETNAVFEYLWAKESTEDSLKKVFRAVKRIKSHRIGDSDGWLYKCFIGSSKFNVGEMTQLIDVVMRFCYELDIETDERMY